MDTIVTIGSTVEINNFPPTTTAIGSSNICGSLNPEKTKPLTKWNYHRDIQLTFENQTYTLGELVQMDDEKFHSFYQLYSDYISAQYSLVDPQSQSLSSSIINLGIITTLPNIIDTMERIVLERRLVKLENKN